METAGRLYREISAILRELGVPVRLSGYQYLREAIWLTVEDMSRVHAVTKVLYPLVAERFDTTPSRVERAIRTAIGAAWERAEAETLQKYFGCRVNNAKGKPANAAFIALIADGLLLREKQ